MHVMLYDADSLEYSGRIQILDDGYDFIGVTNERLLEMPKTIPIKGLLSNLICFNLVYDIIEE